MGWKKLVIFSFFAIVGCNALFKNYYRTKDRGIRPKRPKFELAKKNYSLTKNDIIDTSAVYIYQKEVVYGNGEKEIEEYFYRFFSNGKCIRGFPSDFKRNKLILSDFNNLNRGGSFIGYYQIKDSNNLVTETFSVGVGENGKYIKDYGVLKGDTIFLFNAPFTKEKINKGNVEIYIRKKVEGLTGTPDW
ncbi:hypothetical protein [Aquimarina sediminis]|uniref:hypothetical protein n=1 Tax=Aquimarina sediminis TaxID=2070536 RepID=UPI000CA08C78|nr:hypothetical protein [Aquimarina sediminis]